MTRYGQPGWALLVGVLTLVMYATTIVSTVGWTDTGELMAVAYTLGTAHPTGYPFMTVLARTWLLVPTGLRVAVQLNLLSAFLVAASASLFFLALRRWYGVSRKGVEQVPVWASLASVLALASSTTFWVQSSSYEVYALHLALMSAVLASYGTAVLEQERATAGASRWWFVCSYLVGLSFANHMTTVLFGPALAWDYYRRFGTSRSAWHRLLRISPMALLGLSMYAVLAVRASSGPPLNWGDPSTWEGFWRHVSGAQYREWMFSGAGVMSRQWAYFVENLPAEYFWPWLMLAGWGWLVSWRRWKRAAEFVSLLSVTGVAYSINYDIHEIGPYFLVVYVAMSFAIVPGIIDVHERIIRRSHRAQIVVPVVGAILLIWQVVEHYPRIPAANTSAVERFAKSVLQSVDRNAFVLTGRWDYLYSPALYLQHVEGLRTDVLVVDHSLLRDRTWYVEGLRRRAPWLDHALREEFEGFLRELRKFERGEPLVPAVIQMRWEALQTGIVREAMRSRPVYLDMSLAAELRAGSAEPIGHLMRLRKGEKRYDGVAPEKIPIDGNDSAYLSDFRDYLATSFLQHAFAATERGEVRKADSLVAIAAEYSPRHPWLSRFPLSSKKLGQ